MDALESVMNWRDEIDRQREADAAIRDAERQRREEWNSWEYHHDNNPLTNPAVRREKNQPVNRERECRADYDTYNYTQFLQAQDECNGNLLNKKGRDKVIDPESLFEGQASIANAYASDELMTWWAHNGRVTYAEWKFEALGRPSDRRAAQTARFQSLREHVL
jgi:hypothetical protein